MDPVDPERWVIGNALVKEVDESTNTFVSQQRKYKKFLDKRGNNLIVESIRVI